MSLLSFVRVMFGTARRLRTNSKKAQTLAALPMPSLVQAWLAALDPPGERVTTLRPPVPRGVEAMEAKLGFAVPPDVRRLYELCDGVANPTEDTAYPIVSVSDLRRAGEYAPALSTQIEAQWKEWGEADGDPRALRVFPAGYLAALTDRSEREVEFSFADDLLALQPPENGRCLTVLTAPQFEYAAGTVFEIENLTATRYESLSNWLATSASFV